MDVKDELRPLNQHIMWVGNYHNCSALENFIHEGIGRFLAVAFEDRLDNRLVREAQSTLALQVRNEMFSAKKKFSND